MNVHTFIFSCLYYCNVLHLGISQRSLLRLQLVQNAAAHLITGTKRHDHITPGLASLQWLPVKYRIDFKVLLISFKAPNGPSTDYIKDLLICQPQISMDLALLETPKSTKGDQAFSVWGPTPWNSLPSELRHIKYLGTYKTHLKTFLFTKAFGDLWSRFIFSTYILVYAYI